MSKRSGKQPRRFWSKREEEFLMGCMTDLVDKKHKPEAQFGTAQAWVSLGLTQG